MAYTILIKEAYVIPEVLLILFIHLRIIRFVVYLLEVEISARNLVDANIRDMIQLAHFIHPRIGNNTDSGNSVLQCYDTSMDSEPEIKIPGPDKITPIVYIGKHLKHVLQLFIPIYLIGGQAKVLLNCFC